LAQKLICAASSLSFQGLLKLLQFCVDGGDAMQGIAGKGQDSSKRASFSSFSMVALDSSIWPWASARRQD